MEHLVVWHVDVAADAGGYDASSLLLGFFCHDATHYVGIAIVEVAYGLIDKEEVEGLAEGADECHALLLSEGHAAYGGVDFVSYAEHLEPLKYLFLLLFASELVFDDDIFEGCELREQAQFLPHEGEMLAADGCPL